MDDLIAFDFDISDAIIALEHAIYIMQDCDGWEDMEDYVTKLEQARKLIEIPESIKEQIDDYSEMVYNAECLADRNSY